MGPSSDLEPAVAGHHAMVAVVLVRVGVQRAQYLNGNAPVGVGRHVRLAASRPDQQG